MPFIPFLIYSTLGSVVWVSFLTGAGYVFGSNYERVGTYLKPISTIVLISLLSAAIYFIIKRKTTINS